MKRGPEWGVVACNVGAQCQNLNWISAQTTGVVQLTPNFVDHLVLLIKHDLHQKNHIFRTFAQLTPSDIIPKQTENTVQHTCTGILLSAQVLQLYHGLNEVLWKKQ